jgi:hypothetical protein
MSPELCEEEEALRTALLTNPNVEKERVHEVTRAQDVWAFAISMYSVLVCEYPWDVAR